MRRLGGLLIALVTLCGVDCTRDRREPLQTPEGAPVAASSQDTVEKLPTTGNQAKAKAKNNASGAVVDTDLPAPSARPQPTRAPSPRAATLDAPLRYPPTRTLSPLTPAVARTVRGIARTNPALRDDVFMKVGASGSASPHLLRCLAGSDVVLGGFQPLLPTLTAFRRANAAGASPLVRKSLAAKPGRSAGWAIGGSPSPVEQELTAISPRFALVHYGTNDMHLAQDFAAALQPFGRNLVRLIDGLTSRGVIPVLGTLSPRLDNAEANLWVPTYNQLVRAVAQARRIPLLDMHTAMLALPNRGRASDLLHANVLRDGGRPRPCVFTDRGLRYAYNVRNYLSLRILDQLRRMVLGLDYDEEPSTPALAGAGSAESPFVIDGLPFADLRDMRRSPNVSLDGYQCPGTARAQRTGPEFVYRLKLLQPTAVRIMAANLPGTDVEVVLLGERGQRCLAFGGQRLEGRMPAGTYRIAVETRMSGDDEPQWGEFALSVVRCSRGDSACEEPLVR